MGRKSSCPRPKPQQWGRRDSKPLAAQPEWRQSRQSLLQCLQPGPSHAPASDLFGASGHSLLSGARGMQCLALHRADFGQSPSEPEDVLSNAGQGWVEGRQGICQRECCPTQTEQSARMALAKHLSSRGPALPKGCCPALAVVPGIPSHGGRA